MLDPFADGYYKVGEKEKARDLLRKLCVKYQQSLKQYHSMSIGDQNFFSYDIKVDIERYRSVLKIMKENEDMEFYNSNKNSFNTINKMLQRFGRKMEN